MEMETKEFELEIYAPNGDILAVGIERSEIYYPGTDDCPPSSMDAGFKIMYFMLGDGEKFYRMPDWLTIEEIESMVYEF
jgi:hypothetical protein